MQGKQWKKILRIVAVTLAVLCLAVGIYVLCINSYMIDRVDERIVTDVTEDADCILVLGCLVKSDGAPSNMLEDRLATGVLLYKAGVAPKLLMSGDHGREDYDEVNAMKAYAVSKGVPDSDVFMDHAGFSTYESIYRAKEIFGAKKIVIVSQKYHLSRALYIAEELGLDAYGVPADVRTYRNQWVRDIREVLARVKDFFVVQFKPEPTYLGDPISLEGDGNVTND